MSNELKEKLHSQTALINLDGFDGIDTYTDEREGGDLDQDQVASPRLIQGIRIGFNTKQAIWVDESDQPLPNTLRLIFANVIRIVQKWGTDNLPIIDETIILGPNEKWPNIDAMNEKCPKTEWRLRHGQHVGPYEPQKLVYLWDPNTMQKYTWPASNNSSMACVSDLSRKNPGVSAVQTAEGASRY